MTVLLEWRDIVRGFGGAAPVLNGVTLTVKREEIVGLLGRNGAGKTTLLHLAMGMLHPHAGTVRVFGLAPTEHPVAVKRRIGYVAEDQVLPLRAKICDLLSLHRTLFPSWDAALERQLMDRFGLRDQNRRMHTLSKGEARQVALICAVCHRPELLILDEPAGGLDPAARREFLETSIQLLNREGTSIIFSSHHMGDVERLGGRVALLDGGIMQLDAELDVLREQYSVAILPCAPGLEQATVARLPHCIRVRKVGHAFHAVFHGHPELVQRQLRDALGVVDAQCQRVPLEELFVALVGAERLEKAS
jgi:ABC-2 type transport system ATP-binding protein